MRLVQGDYSFAGLSGHDHRRDTVDQQERDTETNSPLNESHDETTK